MEYGPIPQDLERAAQTALGLIIRKVEYAVKYGETAKLAILPQYEKTTGKVTFVLVARSANGETVILAEMMTPERQAELTSGNL